MRLANKVAVVTGAVGAIGSATARAFLTNGACVMLVDRDERGLTEMLAGLAGERAAGVVADVTRVADVVRYAEEAVQRFGSIDVFFNNAGIEGAVAPLCEYPDDAFDAVMAVNVRGVFLGMKHVLPRMNDGGSAIVTSSVAGLQGTLKTVGYVASKHAVIGIMRCAALDAAARRIRVNSVHPAMVESDMVRRIERQYMPDNPEQVRRNQLTRLRLGRYITPEEVAATVVFLASDESRMTTGQTVVVDGGYLL